MQLTKLCCPLFVFQKMKAIKWFRVLLCLTIPMKIGISVSEDLIGLSVYDIPWSLETSIASVFISGFLSILFCKCCSGNKMNQNRQYIGGNNNFGIQQPMMIGGYNNVQMMQPLGYTSYQQGMQPMQNFMFPPPQTFYQQ